MVYNNAHFAPTSLTEKLRAKFSDRTAGAIFRANSESREADGEVLSFFGRADGTAAGERAIPSQRRSHTARPAAKVSSANVKNAPRDMHRGPRHAQSERTARPAQARPAAHPMTRTAPGTKKPPQPKMSPMEMQMRTGSFSKAYAAGDRVKNMSSRVRVPGEGRYSERKISKKALAGGRRDIPGSRRAALKSDLGEAEQRGWFARFKASVKDVQRAEHRVKSSPMPIAYTAIIIVCAIMAMVLLLSHSQVSEREGMIGDLSAKYDQLAKDTAELELQLEERDDIRKIEDMAVSSLGMVSGDVAQSRFVSVSAEDKVEILREDTEDGEGGFSALLSVVGEGLGKFSEYFNGPGSLGQYMIGGVRKRCVTFRNLMTF